MYLVNLNLDRSNISPYISTTLINGIEKQLNQGKKIILYINKRGAFSSMICADCSYLFECHQCDSSLNVHHNPDMLTCHLCGHKEPLPKVCKSCGKNNIKSVGVGTQQIEDALGKYFNSPPLTPPPSGEGRGEESKKQNGRIKIFRFDSDSMKNKTDKATAIKQINEANIIIGTKMITTGFDFDNIGLIGVILIEAELKIPKYNTHEKVYNNITQLLGRGGRKGSHTDYIIQTFIPNNTLINNITGDNYKDFFIHTLQERKLFGYPPFKQFAILEYRHANREKSIDFLSKIGTKLEKNISKDFEVIKNPNVFKRNNQYFSTIIVKGENIRKNLQTIKSDIFSHSGLTIHFE